MPTIRRRSGRRFGAVETPVRRAYGLGTALIPLAAYVDGAVAPLRVAAVGRTYGVGGTGDATPMTSDRRTGVAGRSLATPSRVDATLTPMTAIRDLLSNRPLSASEVAALESQYDDIGVAPVGFLPDLGIVAAFVVIVDDERGHSLRFDRERDRWEVVESFGDDDDFSAVTARLREWVGDDWDGVDEQAVTLPDEETF